MHNSNRRRRLQEAKEVRILSPRPIGRSGGWVDRFFSPSFGLT